MWQAVGNIFRDYMGKGLLMGWFLLMLLFLWKREQEKMKRILFVYFPVSVLVIFFNPLVYRICYRFIGNEIYYRILWLLPVSMTISYGMLQVGERVASQKKKWVLCIFVLGVIASGSLIYKNPNYSKAQNINHVPEAVVEICDEIEIEGREVMAVFPKELLSYVRQYSALVCMPYGREELVEQWATGHPIFLLMEKDSIELDELLPLCKEEECHYLILPMDKEIIGDFGKYDYVFVKNICGYNLYRDTTMYLGF